MVQSATLVTKSLSVPIIAEERVKIFRVDLFLLALQIIMLRALVIFGGKSKSEHNCEFYTRENFVPYMSPSLTG